MRVAHVTLKTQSIFLFLLQLLAHNTLVFEQPVLNWSRLQKVVSSLLVQTESSDM